MAHPFRAATVNATCPGGIEIHADEGGAVYINGDEARLKKFNDNYFEAAWPHNYLDQHQPGRLRQHQLHGAHGAKGVCREQDFSAIGSEPSGGDSGGENARAERSLPQGASPRRWAYQTRARSACSTPSGPRPAPRCASRRLPLRPLGPASSTPTAASRGSTTRGRLSADGSQHHPADRPRLRRLHVGRSVRGHPTGWR